MLNQTTEHALRALLFLAQRPHGESVSADRMARALGAPANYLGKTLNALVRHGVLRSTRGPAGGFRLARLPHQITLAEVARLFAEARPSTTCLLGDRPCRDSAPCSAHHRWLALREELESPLRRTTVADLLASPVHEVPGSLPVATPVHAAASAA